MSNINSRTASGRRTLDRIDLVSPEVSGEGLIGRGNVNITGFQKGTFRSVENEYGLLEVNSISGSAPIDATTENGHTSLSLAIDQDTLTVDPQGRLSTLQDEVIEPLARTAHTLTLQYDPETLQVTSGRLTVIPQLSGVESPLFINDNGLISLRYARSFQNNEGFYEDGTLLPKGLELKVAQPLSFNAFNSHRLSLDIDSDTLTLSGGKLSAKLHQYDEPLNENDGTVTLNIDATLQIDNDGKLTVVQTPHEYPLVHEEGRIMLAYSSPLGASPEGLTIGYKAPFVVEDEEGFGLAIGDRLEIDDDGKLNVKDASSLMKGAQSIYVYKNVLDIPFADFDFSVGDFNDFHGGIVALKHDKNNLSQSTGKLCLKSPGLGLVWFGSGLGVGMNSSDTFKFNDTFNRLEVNKIRLNNVSFNLEPEEVPSQAYLAQYIQGKAGGAIDVDTETNARRELSVRHNETLLVNENNDLGVNVESLVDNVALTAVNDHIALNLTSKNAQILVDNEQGTIEGAIGVQPDSGLILNENVLDIDKSALIDQETLVINGTGQIVSGVTYGAGLTKSTDQVVSLDLQSTNTQILVDNEQGSITGNIEVQEGSGLVLTDNRIDLDKEALVDGDTITVLNGKLTGNLYHFGSGFSVDSQANGHNAVNLELDGDGSTIVKQGTQFRGNYQGSGIVQVAGNTISATLSGSNGVTVAGSSISGSYMGGVNQYGSVTVAGSTISYNPTPIQIISGTPGKLIVTGTHPVWTISLIDLTFNRTRDEEERNTEDIEVRRLEDTEPRTVSLSFPPAILPPPPPPPPPPILLPQLPAVIPPFPVVPPEEQDPEDDPDPEYIIPEYPTTNIEQWFDYVHIYGYRECQSNVLIGSLKECDQGTRLLFDTPKNWRGWTYEFGQQAVNISMLKDYHQKWITPSLGALSSKSVIDLASSDVTGVLPVSKVNVSTLQPTHANLTSLSAAAPSIPSLSITNQLKAPIIQDLNNQILINEPANQGALSSRAILTGSAAYDPASGVVTLLNGAGQAGTYYYQCNPGNYWEVSFDYLWDGGGDGTVFAIYQTAPINIFQVAADPLYLVRFGLRFNNPALNVQTPNGFQNGTNFVQAFPSVNTWYSVAIRYTNGSMFLYVNDTLMVSNNGPSNQTDVNAQGTYLGFSSWTGGLSKVDKIRNFKVTRLFPWSLVADKPSFDLSSKQDVITAANAATIRSTLGLAPTATTGQIDWASVTGKPASLLSLSQATPTVVSLSVDGNITLNTNDGSNPRAICSEDGTQALVFRQSGMGVTSLYAWTAVEIFTGNFDRANQVKRLSIDAVGNILFTGSKLRFNGSDLVTNDTLTTQLATKENQLTFTGGLSRSGASVTVASDQSLASMALSSSLSVIANGGRVQLTGETLQWGCRTNESGDCIAEAPSAFRIRKSAGDLSFAGQTGLITGSVINPPKVLELQGATGRVLIPTSGDSALTVTGGISTAGRLAVTGSTGVTHDIISNNYGNTLRIQNTHPSGYSSLEFRNNNDSRLVFFGIGALGADAGYQDLYLSGTGNTNFLIKSAIPSVQIDSGVDASNSTNGALQVKGGASIAKNLYVGSSVYAEGTKQLATREYVQGRSPRAIMIADNQVLSASTVINWTFTTLYTNSTLHFSVSTSGFQYGDNVLGAIRMKINGNLVSVKNQFFNVNGMHIPIAWSFTTTGLTAGTQTLSCLFGELGFPGCHNDSNDSISITMIEMPN